MIEDQVMISPATVDVSIRLHRDSKRINRAPPYKATQFCHGLLEY